MENKQLILKPIGNKVLIKRDQVDQKKDLILRVENNPVKPNRGIVIGVGPEVNYVKIGDPVMFPTYSGLKIAQEGDDNDYLLFPENELWGVLPNENLWKTNK